VNRGNSPQAETWLSAWLDDEAECREDALERLLHDPGLRAKWCGYHAIGDCLRSQFSGRARLLRPVPPRRRRLALAFGCALAGLLTFGIVMMLAPAVGDRGGNRENVAAIPDLPARIVSRAPVELTPPQRRLAIYLVHHSEYLAHSSAQGMFSYARIVAAAETGP